MPSLCSTERIQSTGGGRETRREGAGSLTLERASASAIRTESGAWEGQDGHKRGPGKIPFLTRTATSGPAGKDASPHSKIFRSLKPPDSFLERKTWYLVNIGFRTTEGWKPVLRERGSGVRMKGFVLTGPQSPGDGTVSPGRPNSQSQKGLRVSQEPGDQLSSRFLLPSPTLTYQDN